MASTEQIAKSLLEMEHCSSDSMRQMLLKGLPHAFGGSRHEYQLEYAKLLSACLKQEQNYQQQTLEKCATEADGMKAAFEVCQADVGTATERVEAARAVVEEKASALSLKQQASKTEEGRYVETQTMKEAAVLEHQMLEELKAEADSVANGSLQMLINGGWEDDDACQDFVSGVLEYLKAMNCESPLLAAVPKALGSRPEARGMFDKITLDEVVRIMDAKVASATSMVEQEKDKIEDINATYLGAWAIWDIACDAEKAGAKAHEEAQEELQAQISEQGAMAAKVADTSLSLEKITSAKAINECKVREIELSLGELQRLESPEDQEDKENADVPQPSPKKQKIDMTDNNIDVQVQPVNIAVQ